MCACRINTIMWLLIFVALPLIKSYSMGDVVGQYSNPAHDWSQSLKHCLLLFIRVVVKDHDLTSRHTPTARQMIINEQAVSEEQLDQYLKDRPTELTAVGIDFPEEWPSYRQEAIDVLKNSG